FVIKLIISIVIGSLCLLQVQANRRTCEQISRVCARNEARIGIEDDVTKYLNAECRRRDIRWRNITRCQLERAACECKLQTKQTYKCLLIIKFTNM
ncbi:hypothetical protein KR044_005354, partial [Drosophila immigrans]